MEQTAAPPAGRVTFEQSRTTGDGTLLAISAAVYQADTVRRTAVAQSDDSRLEPALDLPMRLKHTRVHGIHFVLVIAAALAAAAHVAIASERHLALVKSEPANAATLAHSPASIRLHFSQRPNLKLTRITLIGPAGDTLKTGTPVAIKSDDKQVCATIGAALPAGKYSVSWRTLSRDGHAVAGSFSFSVTERKGDAATQT
ncbi:MAG: copper resistance CopC family protein [Gemmatimonadaceae bacterium]